MRSTTRSPGRRARHRTTPQDRAFRLALVALILAALLASCSGEPGSGANRALDRVRDFSERFDLVAERFVAPIRDALQGMASSLQSAFGRFVGGFPR
jgi:hypothetical protein